MFLPSMSACSITLYPVVLYLFLHGYIYSVCSTIAIQRYIVQMIVYIVPRIVKSRGLTGNLQSLFYLHQRSKICYHFKDGFPLHIKKAYTLVHPWLTTPVYQRHSLVQTASECNHHHPPPVMQYPSSPLLQGLASGLASCHSTIDGPRQWASIASLTPPSPCRTISKVCSCQGRTRTHLSSQTEQ